MSGLAALVPNRFSFLPVFLLAAVGVHLHGCGADGRSPTLVERSDSAGVEIVRNSGGADALLDRSFEPAFSFGGADAGPASFYRIWPHGVDTDARGNIYVLDASAHRVVVFDARGTHLRTFGREGGGPGELVAPAAVAVHPDGRVAVYDFARRGLVWFAPDGAALPNEPLAVEFRGGRFHLSDAGAYVPVREIERERGLARLRLLHIGPADTSALAQQEQPLGRQIEYAGCAMSITLPPLFTPGLVWDVRAGAAAVVGGADYVIDVYDGAARRRSIRLNVAARVVTEQMARAQVGDGEEWTWESGRCTVPADEVVARRGFVERLPALERVALAPGGEIWARRTVVRGEPSRVDVFAVSGEYLGTLPQGSPWPVAFLPDGRLIAIEKDELDVERLVIYRMAERGAPAPGAAG